MSDAMSGTIPAGTRLSMAELRVHPAPSLIDCPLGHANCDSGTPRATNSPWTVTKGRVTVKLHSPSLISTVAGACLILAATQTFAQKPPRQPPAGPPRVGTDVGTRTEVRTRSETKTLRSSLMIGSTVNLQGGVEFGTVEEFILSPSGCVDFIVVTYEDRYYPIPWTIASFNFQERIVLLEVDRQFIQSAPVFTQVSEFSNTQFVQKVNSYYKVEGRRVEPRPDGRTRDGAGSRGRDRDGDADDTRNSDKDRPRDARKPGDKATDDRDPKAGAGKKPDADKKPLPEKKPDADKKPLPEKKPDADKSPAPDKKPGEAKKPLPPEPKDKPAPGKKPSDDEKKSDDDRS
jgi:hypothetical protein